jgi:hypothetical protein
MTELIQFFIETAGLSGEHLAGMLFAGVIVLVILCVAAYQILDLLVSWFRYIKPIKITRVQKVDKIVEVPKYVDNKADYNQVISLLKSIEKKQKGTSL